MRLIAGLLLAAAVGGCGQATPTHSVLPSSPPGGISKDRAIALAEPNKSLTTTFESAAAGRFHDLNTNPNIGPGFGIKPDQWLWAVTYKGDMTICSPSPRECQSPRPGTLTVFLDYFTGDFLGSEGYSLPG